MERFHEGQIVDWEGRRHRVIATKSMGNDTCVLGRPIDEFDPNEMEISLVPESQISFLEDHAVKVPRLFNLNAESPEYIAAYDLESAIEFHRRDIVGYPPDDKNYEAECLFHPREITPSEMGDRVFEDDDGTTRSFAVEFLRVIQEETLPMYFACRER